jgi:hypothetical protein
MPATTKVIVSASGIRAMSGMEESKAIDVLENGWW